MDKTLRLMLLSVNKAELHRNIFRSSGIAKVHRTTLELFVFFEDKATRGLRQREYQVLSMYKDDAGGAELQGIARYHRSLWQTLGSLEAEHTRVATKTSRPSNDATKILSRIYRVYGHPRAMKIRTFCPQQSCPLLPKFRRPPEFGVFQEIAQKIAQNFLCYSRT